MIRLADLKNTTKALSEYALMPQNTALKARIYAKDFLKTLETHRRVCVENAFVKKGAFVVRAKSHTAFAELKHQSVMNEIQNALEIYAKNKPQSEFAGLKVKIQAPFDAFKKDARTSNGLAKMNADEKPLFERAKGEFRNAFEPQSELFKKFESLRKSVKKHNELLKLVKLQGK